MNPANARFYTDTTGASGVKYLYDPKTGESNIPVYNFNLATRPPVWPSRKTRSAT